MRSIIFFIAAIFIATISFGQSFTDDFNGSTLDTRWTVVSPNPNSSVTLTGSGSLQLFASTLAGGSDYYSGTNFNAPRLVTPVSGDWTIETQISFSPTNNYQGVAFLLLSQTSPTSQTGSRVAERAFYPAEGGQVIRSVGGYSVNPITTFYLKIRKQGNNFTGWYGSDSNNLSASFSSTDPTPYFYAGLVCIRQPWDGDTNIHSTAIVDYFKLTVDPHIYYGKEDGTIWSTIGDGSADQFITHGYWPKVSPDGQFLLFRKGPQSTISNKSIYVLNLTTNVENLAFNNPNVNVNSNGADSWFYDNSKILFDFDFDIRTVNRDGTGITVVSNANGVDDAPDVRPDNAAMTFHNYQIGLFTANVNGTARTQIPNTLPGDFLPQWSKDGQWITFTRTNVSPVVQYKIHPDGTGLTALTNLSAGDVIHNVSWTTDGSRLIMSGIIGCVPGLFEVAADGSKVIKRLAAPITTSAPNFVGGVIGAPPVAYTPLTPAPSISSIAPSNGYFGTTVTITGTNLLNTTTVRFNATPATSFTVVSSTTITAIVPAGATTGTISVTNGCNTGTSAANFTVVPSPVPASGLKLWLRADDLTLANNSLVSFWPDASGLDNDFTSTGSNRPMFKTNGCPNILNGKPYISYEVGTNLFLGRNDVLGMVPNTARTFIAVYKLINPSQRAFVIEQGDYTTNETYFGTDANTWATQGNRFGVYATRNSYDTDLATDDLYHIHFITANTMAVGTNVISDVEYRVDDNLATLIPRDLQAGGNYKSFANANEMRINGNANVAEVIAYDRALTASERNDIVTYLRQKYSFTPKLPTLTSFSPATGTVGTTVIITGTNFSNSPGDNIVYFGATQAIVTAATSTQLTVTVPSGATYQPITVEVCGLTAYSLEPFVVTYPGGGAINTCSFAPALTVPAGSNSRSVSYADIDNDGKPDLVVVNQAINTISIFRNTSTAGTIGSGSFAARVDFATGSNPIGLTTGDLDGDGKLDIIVTNQFGNSVSILRNTATTGIINAASLAARFDIATGNRPHEVTVGDIDLDGKPEVVVSNYSSNNFSILRNISSPGSLTASSFAPKVDFTSGADVGEIAIGDLDGDNKPEIVIANASNNTISIFRNTSVAGVINSTSLATRIDLNPGVNPWAVNLFDVDNDGKLDVTVATEVSNTVAVFRNVSTPGILSLNPKVDFATGSQPASYAFTDVDGDGNPDLIVSNSSSNSISVFKNLGLPGTISTGSFAPKIDFAAGLTAYDLAVGDIDGDSRPEIVTANYGGNNLSIFHNLMGTVSIPTITSISPVQGIVGSPVTITGTNFTGATQITFNGTPASSLTVVSPTTITTTIPTGATSGFIQVTVGCNAATSSSTFTVCSLLMAPTVTNSSGCSGASILLSAAGGSAGNYRWYNVASGGQSMNGVVNEIFTTPTLTLTTSFWVTVVDGICESDRTEVVATVLPLPASPTVQQPNPVCIGTTATLTVSGSMDSNYRWYDRETLLTGEVNSSLLINNVTISKTYGVSIFDGVCESVKTSVALTVQNCTPPVVASSVSTAFIEGLVVIDLEPLIADEEDNVDPSTLSISQQPESGAQATLSGFVLTIDYSGHPFTGTDRVSIEVCDFTSMCSEQQLTIELGGEVTVYNAVSPNNDGLNDFFFIQYIDLLPQTQSNTVYIYSRWGDEVFSVNNYNNTTRVFKGESNSGSKLPSGTYFYKIVTGSTKARTGFLSLKY